MFGRDFWGLLAMGAALAGMSVWLIVILPAIWAPTLGALAGLGMALPWCHVIGWYYGSRIGE